MSSYLDDLNKLARKRQMELTKEQQVAIYKAYNIAADRYYEKFIENQGNGTATNAAQLEYARELSKRLETIIEKYSIAASQNALATIADVMDESYDRYGLSGSPYAQSVKQLLQTAVDDSARRIILGDIYKDGKGLSERIWNATNRSGEKINEVIAACMAQQMSAVEMSKIVKDFMKPGGTVWDRRKIREKLGPGYASWNKEVSYEALRLARTTITHSATLALKEAGRVNPYVNSARWHSVHAVGRTCDICTARDGQVFTLAKLPFDHPNGLCWNEPILDKSITEIGRELDNWLVGVPNSRLDTFWNTHGLKHIPIPSIRNAQQGGPRPGDKGTPEWYDKEFSKFKDQLGDHWPRIREMIKDSPEWIQDWYRQNQDKLNYAGLDTEDPRAAYYHPAYRHIKMSLVTDGNVNNPRGQYSTFFHEFGHLLDDLTLKSRMQVMSRNMEFYKALESDYNRQAEHFKKVLASNGYNVDDYFVGTMTQSLRKDGDVGSGVQDIISGLTLNEIRAGWGHSTDYWTRGNTKAEISSEAFAHMSSAYTNPERLAVMKKWFPTACDIFEQIIKKSLK